MFLLSQEYCSDGLVSHVWGGWTAFGMGLSLAFAGGALFLGAAFCSFWFLSH